MNDEIASKAAHDGQDSKKDKKAYSKMWMDPMFSGNDKAGIKDIFSEVLPNITSLSDLDKLPILSSS